MADPKKPAPDASAQEIAEYLSKAKPEEAKSWLASNAGGIELKVLEDIYTRVNMDSRTELDPVKQELVDKITKTQDTRAVERERQAQVDSVSEQIQAGGVDKDEADRQADQIVGQNRGEFRVEPDIIMQAYGKAPSTKQQTELISTWNELNPDAPVRTYDQLVGVMNDNPSNPMIEDVVSYATTGMEPTKVYEWTVEGGRGNEGEMSTVRLSEGQFEALKSIYGSGFGTKDVKKLAQMAKRIGLTDSSGGGVGWQILAAGAASMGMFNIGERADAADATAAANRIDPETSRALGAAGTAMDRAANTAQNLTNRELTRLRNWGVQYVQGMRMYGQNDSLAFLHAMSAPLATRVATTQFDKLSTMDKKQTYSFMMNAGFDAENLGKLGYGWTAGIEEAGVNRASAGGGGPVRQMPDPDAIRQSAKDMYRTLFAAEPTDEQLNQLVGSVTGAIASADIDGADGVVQDVNASAQIRKRLQEMPEYGDLYGQKPAGMAEEEYQAQFRNGAASILGNAAARPDVVRAGMRSGNYNTSVGAAAMTREAWEGSTFLGRLAQAAQITSENT